MLEAGADEYIQWPDTIGEGIASAKALLRRYTDLNRGGGEPSQTFFRNGVLVSPERRSVFIHGQEIQFQKKEFDLFCLLASNPGRVFTNEQLYEKIWDGEYIRSSDDALNSCLRRVRRKLENVPGAGCRIENRKGVGYCFIQCPDMDRRNRIFVTVQPADFTVTESSHLKSAIRRRGGFYSNLYTFSRTLQQVQSPGLNRYEFLQLGM